MGSGPASNPQLLDKALESLAVALRNVLDLRTAPIFAPFKKALRRPLDAKSVVAAKLAWPIPAMCNTIFEYDCLYASQRHSTCENGPKNVTAKTSQATPKVPKPPGSVQKASADPTAQSQKPGGAASGENERYIVPGLRRGLAMLRLFNTRRRVISVPEMVRELRVSRATAFRLAYTLEADGFLQRTPHSSAFQLGLNVLSLGFEYLGSLDLVEIGQPVLEGLRDRMDASAHMGVRDGTEVVYILSAPSKHRLRNHVPAGIRMPAHATSIGRVLLFDMQPEALHELYRGIEMQKFSPDTPDTVEALCRDLERERAAGYVSYRSEYSQGIASVAAPVRDQSGRIVAGVNVSDYESLSIMQEQEGRLKDEVLSAAAAISSGLGYRGS